MQHSRTEEVAARTGGRAVCKLRYQFVFLSYCKLCLWTAGVASHWKLAPVIHCL